VNVRAVVEMDTSEACTFEAAQTDMGVSPAKVYGVLSGVAPERAGIESEDDFDRHVLASILSIAASEGGPLASRVGLSDAHLSMVLATYFPSSRFSPPQKALAANEPDLDEIEMVRNLLIANKSSDVECASWLAAMVARRALEPNHLWEDLGLRNRSELTRLIARHFAPLATRNDKNMRWKRFIYRVMCEDDGFVMCASPVCTNCADHHLCFGEEAGQSRVASEPAETERLSRRASASSSL